MLLCYLLYLEGQPAAFWMGPFYGQVFYSDFIGFDPAYSKYSPGTVLQAKVVEDLCARQAVGIDFGPGDALYKARLGTNCHEEASLYVYAPTLRGLVLNLLRTLTALVDKTAKGFARRLGLFSMLKRISRKTDGSQPPLPALTEHS